MLAPGAIVLPTANGAGRVNDVMVATKEDAEDGGRFVGEAVAAIAGIERASAEIGEIILAAEADGLARKRRALPTR